uniref:Surfeit locus protein 6 n=1 Tax=Schistocephalus solidus TaxID=70667 RepID=A0A0V0J8Y8_SCHSO
MPSKRNAIAIYKTAGTQNERRSTKNLLRKVTFFLSFNRNNQAIYFEHIPYLHDVHFCYSSRYRSDLIRYLLSLSSWSIAAIKVIVFDKCFTLLLKCLPNS